MDKSRSHRQKKSTYLKWLIISLNITHGLIRKEISEILLVIARDNSSDRNFSVFGCYFLPNIILGGLTILQIFPRHDQDKLGVWDHVCRILLGLLSFFKDTQRVCTKGGGRLHGLHCFHGVLAGICGSLARVACTDAVFFDDFFISCILNFNSFQFQNYELGKK